MAETTAPAPAMSRAEEEANFYHESALNANWTGVRLALGGMSFLFGAFIFSYFYLRSLNSYHLWYLAPGPKVWVGTVIMALTVVSAGVQTVVLQVIKGGKKAPWLTGATVALVLGLVSVGFEVWQLIDLPFWPGHSGFSSVFVGFWPVYLTIALCVLIWLDMLIVRCRPITEISFVEQPPTYAEA